jgi:predicted amidohydrolase
MEYRVALAQIAPRLGEVEANLELIAARTRDAIAAAADLIVFPELALTGYQLQDLVPEVAVAADDPRLAAISRDAPEAVIVIGFVEETPEHRYCNSAVVLRGGELIGVHRKLYLPTYGLFDEARFTSEGDRIRAFEVGLPIGRLGVGICEDFWHPSVPMLLAQDGASLLVNPAAGPARAPGSATGTAAMAAWQKMHDTYATLFTTAVAFCNRVGNEEGLTFWGGSRLIAPDGGVVVEAPRYEEALVIGAINADDLRMTRYNLPLLADERLELVRRELERLIADRAGVPADPIATQDHPAARA